MTTKRYIKTPTTAAFHRFACSKSFSSTQMCPIAFKMELFLIFAIIIVKKKLHFYCYLFVHMDKFFKLSQRNKHSISGEMYIYCLSDL